MYLEHILYKRLCQATGPLCSSIQILMAASSLDPKSNIDPEAPMDSYGLMTLGSMADFCSVWSPHCLKVNTRLGKQGLRPPKPSKIIEPCKKYLVHDWGIGHNHLIL